MRLKGIKVSTELWKSINTEVECQIYNIVSQPLEEITSSTKNLIEVSNKLYNDFDFNIHIPINLQMYQDTK